MGDNGERQGTSNALNTSEVDGRMGNQGGQPGTLNVLNMSEVDGRMGMTVTDWGD